MSTPTSTLSPDYLTAELQARGLPYLAGPLGAPSAPRLKPGELLAELACQEDARLRSALIPLFLQQPYWAEVMPDALKRLGTEGQRLYMGEVRRLYTKA